MTCPGCHMTPPGDLHPCAGCGEHGCDGCLHDGVCSLCHDIERERRELDWHRSWALNPGVSANTAARLEQMRSERGVA